MISPTYYKDFDNPSINTRELYHALLDHHESFDRSLLIEFRDRLEKVLFRKRHDFFRNKKHTAFVKFHPVNWKYHRSKIESESQVNWRDANSKINVFQLDYFTQPSYLTGEITFTSLTEDDKVQIIAPRRKPTKDPEHVNAHKGLWEIFGSSEEEWVKNREEFDKDRNIEYFEDLTLERKAQILKRLTSEANKVHDIVNKDDPYQWHHWKRDIYSLDEPCELSLEEDNEDFKFFFVWRMNLTDPYDLKLFLSWHFMYTFSGDTSRFIDFINFLLMTHRRGITNTYTVDLANNFLADVQSKKFKIPKEDPRYVIIPKKIAKRVKGDSLSSLTSEQTAILFHYHRKAGIIVEDKVLLSDVSLSSAIEVLTGYKGDTRRTLGKLNFETYDKESVISALEKITALIKNDL